MTGDAGRAALFVERNVTAKDDVWGIGCFTEPGARGSMSTVCRRARKRAISGGVNSAPRETTVKYL